MAGDGLQRIALVRHGRPVIDPEVLPEHWQLDSEALPAIHALRDSGRLPRKAVWFCSPEPKALQTARELFDGRIEVNEGLREQVRLHVGWIEDIESVRRRAFAEPGRPAYDGWESLDATRDRIVRSVRQILIEHPEEDIVLVGHATSLSLLAADLTDQPADPELPGRMLMPDLMVVGMSRPARVPSIKVALICAALVFLGEAIVGLSAANFGLVTGGFAGLGLMMSLRPATRALGLSMLAGAVFGGALTLMAGNSVVPS